MKAEQCLCKNIPQKKIDKILRVMPDNERVEMLSELFKLFGDPSRLRIIHILMHQELCVADLAILVNMQQPAVSQQLKLLRIARLVKYRKEGKTIYYALDDKHVSEIFKVALKHLHE